MTMINFQSNEEYKKFDKTNSFSEEGKKIITEYLNGYAGVNYQDIEYCFSEYGDCVKEPVKYFIDIYGAYYSKNLEEVIDYVLENNILLDVQKLSNGDIFTIRKSANVFFPKNN